MSAFVQLHPEDDVVVARTGVQPGTEFVRDDGARIAAQERIELGHKMAIQAVAVGDVVRKYGQMIGVATAPIAAGDWVHTHNLGLGELAQHYEFSTAVPPEPTPITGRTFLGYRRPDQRVGTRNYIAIVSTVNCSATTSKYIARAFDQRILAEFPNVDGILPLVHKGGCAMEFDGPDHRLLTRTLAGFARHPNIAAYLIVGLGCETGQASYLAQSPDLVDWPGSTPRPQPLVMNIQDEGGVAKTVRRGVAALRELLPEVNRNRREPIPVSELILGTNCGGSDGNSGITCNPALGYASDLLVAHGGTSILAETPEIFGGEHLLTRRAITPEVARKLLDRIEWWKDYAIRFGATMDNNPSVGNKRGGLTTIYEKSLGAIAKGGTTALREVYEYAERVTSKGFVVMDTPGFDPPSVTGIVAGGAQVVVFTTGRGSCFGCKPAPTIKVSSNSQLYRRMSDDMDLDAGTILSGTADVPTVGKELFEMILSVASGQPTKSEAQGIGDEEFCPWVPGPVF